MKLEAFNAETICGKNHSPEFPIVRETDILAADRVRVDFYLNDANNGVKSVLEIVRAVNEHAALVAVAETSAALIEFCDLHPMRYRETGTHAEYILRMEKTLRDKRRLAIANLAAVRGESEGVK